MEKSLAPDTKPTVNDIARVAGVSLATVDRVLNGRPGVRNVTIKKVREAIAELGYVRDTAAANLARRRVYNLLFILPRTRNEFVGALERQVSDLANKLVNERTHLRVLHVPPFDPQEVVRLLDAADPSRTDGVALFGPETPGVRDAIKRARARGLAILTLVSDVPSSERNHFVGIDNTSAGRTAAQLMGRFVKREGKVLVITGSRLSRDHLERRQGFDEVMATSFPELQVLASVEARDEPKVVQALLPRVFESYPDIVGIYSSTAGNQGLIRYLRETGRGSDLVVVAHELTTLSRAALLDGTFDALISQNAGHLVRSAVRLMRATADDAPFIASQERIRIDIYIKENVPQVLAD